MEEQQIRIKSLKNTILIKIYVTKELCILNFNLKRIKLPIFLLNLIKKETTQKNIRIFIQKFNTY